MAQTQPYVIQDDVKFAPLELVDVPTLVAACKEQWFNQCLTKVNDCVVRLGIVHGEFHWHVHDHEDEFFYVVSGRLFVDYDDSTVELAPQQGVTVPRGMRHRTRAPERTVMLIIDGAGVVVTGD
ncbi:MAG: cupin domain-containing protein [Candidatus Neomarinimicrobiota bacterium]